MGIDKDLVQPGSKDRSVVLIKLDVCVSTCVRIKLRCGASNNSDVTHGVKLATIFASKGPHPLRVLYGDELDAMRICLGSPDPPARCASLTTVWVSLLGGLVSPLRVFDRSGKSACLDALTMISRPDSFLFTDL